MRKQHHCIVLEINFIGSDDRALLVIKLHIVLCNALLYFKSFFFKFIKVYFSMLIYNRIE